MINLKTALHATSYACAIASTIAFFMAIAALFAQDWTAFAIDGVAFLVLVGCAKINYDGYHRL